MNIDPETQKQLIDALKPLGEKLGQSGAYLFQLATRQAWIDGIECVAIALILLSVFLYGSLTWKKFQAYCECENLDSLPQLWFMVLFACPGFTIMLLINALDLLVNPKYWALKKLIKAVTGN